MLAALFLGIAEAGNIAKYPSKKVITKEKLKPKFGSSTKTTEEPALFVTEEPLLNNSSTTLLPTSIETFESTSSSSTTDNSLMETSLQSEHHELESPIVIESTTLAANLTQIEEKATSNGADETTAEVLETSTAAAVAASAAESDIATANKTNTAASSSSIVPCTCGVFLSSQFTMGSQDLPKGEAVISNSLQRAYPCNGVGQRQCQTKCLEQVRILLDKALGI